MSRWFFRCYFSRNLSLSNKMVILFVQLTGFTIDEVSGLVLNGQDSQPSASDHEKQPRGAKSL